MKNKKLRCDEVAGGLDRSIESADPLVEIDPRLGDGSECSNLLNPDASIMKLWGETAPRLPNEANWDSVWANLSARLDQVEVACASEVAPSSTTRRLVVGHRRRIALVGFVMAQAAVILLVVTLGFRERANSPVPAPLLADVVVETGQTTLIQNNGQKVEIVDLAYAPNTIDPNYELFNAIEAMAN